MATSEIYLPLNLQQVVDLIKQLPKKQKEQIVDLLLQEDEIASEVQKELVRQRMEKYKASPEKLIGEEDVWKLINADE